MRWVFWLVGVIALAGVIHISTILAIPRIAPFDAWSRIAAQIPEKSFSVLPLARPGEEVIPLMDPAIQYSVCRYDLSEGPLHVEAVLPHGYWSVAGQTRSGIVFYSVTGQASPTGRINMEVRNSDQMREKSLADSEEKDDMLTIEAPENQGFLVFRSLVATASMLGQIEDLAKQTACETVAEPAPAQAAQ
ncbi:MAG: DUF1254 domain-containing protein [Rhodobiaceae bacterium]|nr:DUF1254 domain-containing protein [Rhodobiaceae bacterium]MCC0054675.1 DUF1254 domain-containing protein [Rhodobiaceae bacterium]